jgi:2-iminobutanoate/2-iminopropanoate deaminase
MDRQTSSCQVVRVELPGQRYRDVMLRAIAPADLAPPAANYAHAIHTTDVTTWLHTSGVVAVRPDGTVPPALAEQAEVIWANLSAMLAEASMSTADIVSVTTYAVFGEDLAVVMAARDRALGAHRAASTLVLVPGLAQSHWKMEIAIIAAR